MNKKGFAPIAIVVIVIVAILGIAGAYYLGTQNIVSINLPGGSPTSTPLPTTPSQTPSPSPAPTSSPPANPGWNVYQNDEYGFQISIVKCCYKYCCFFRFGDKLPDSARIHLPSCLTRRQLYNQMVEEVVWPGDKPVSLSHFYSCWKKNFPHVKIPPVSQKNIFLNIFIFKHYNLKNIYTGQR